MLGAIIGDIVGSVYEFNNFRSKDFDPLFHRKAFFTDDTVCTVAVADALVNSRHPAAALKDWGTKYWENGGWGRAFAHWLCSDRLEPYNSFGNGAAMRVAPAGLLAKSIEQAIEIAYKVTEVTHNHPEGMKGAAATAAAGYLAKTGNSQAFIRGYVTNILVVDKSIRPRHGQIVVAFVDGQRLVKRLHCRNGRVALLAENPLYPPLEIREDQELLVWGVVIGKFKRFGA